MDHSDDQSDFSPDDDLLMQQEIMLLKIKAYNTSITDEEYQLEEKVIRKKYAYESHICLNKTSILYFYVTKYCFFAKSIYNL